MLTCVLAQEFCLITTTERFLPSLVVGVRSADKFKTVALQVMSDALSASLS